EGVEVGGQVDDAVEATTVGMDAVGKAFVINITSFRQVQRKQGRLATTGGDDGIVDRFQFRQVATKQNALGAGRSAGVGNDGTNAAAGAGNENDAIGEGLGKVAHACLVSCSLLVSWSI